MTTDGACVGLLPGFPAAAQCWGPLAPWSLRRSSLRPSARRRPTKARLVFAHQLHRLSSSPKETRDKGPRGVEASAAANTEVATPRRRVRPGLTEPSEASGSLSVVQKAPGATPDPQALGETGASEGRVGAAVCVVLEEQARVGAAVGARGAPAERVAARAERVAAPAEKVAAPAVV